MPLRDHRPTKRGRLFLWGGMSLGVLLAAAALTHGFGLWAGGRAEATDDAALLHQGNRILVPDSSPLRQRLVVAAAVSEPLSAKLVLPGVVESDPRRTASVLTPLGGRVLSVPVSLGDRVKRGQVLAVIDAPDLAQARDDDAKAADTLHLTEKNLARATGQLQIGAGSDRDVDQARSDHAQATAKYRRTQARLEAIGATQTTAGRGSLLTVRAPIDGSITSLTVVPGTMINDPTQPLLTVADLSTIWVSALVPEKDLGSVIRGEAADVAFEAYPGRRLHGRVLFVSDVLEPDSRRDRVRIAFDNPSWELRPNMFATVTLLAAPRSEVVIPTSAVLMNNDRTSVFVATAPWTFERRVVDAQLEEGANVAIRSGLTAGEQVVVQGGILLND